MHHDVTAWHMCHDVTWRHMTSRRDIMWRHYVRAWHQTDGWTGNIHRPTHKKLQESRFSTWRPWPLTYDPDHQTHPRYHQGQSPRQILASYVKRFNRESAEWQTDAHTDGTDFIPSTADAGGKDWMGRRSTGQRISQKGDHRESPWRHELSWKFLKR